MIKQCSKCRFEKPTDQFHKNKASKDGLKSRCKKCGVLETLAWAAANREKVNKNQAAYRDANQLRITAYNATYRSLNKEKRKEYDATWHAANPEASRISVQNRRARKRAAGGTATPQLV